MASVYVKTLGCKVNTFDGHVLENQFRAQGYDVTESPEAADITIVNTCSVTANADREARYLARRFRRESPDTVLVFTGCYAQTDSARLVAMDEVDFVVPNAAKERLLDIVHEGLAQKKSGISPSKLPADQPLVKDNRQTHFKSSLTLFDQAHSGRTRAFVKVQDGCNGFCTYCLIPYARGQSRSVPSDQVVGEIQRLVAGGTREIVLTGIHIGDYGRDLGEDCQHMDPIVPLLRRIFEIPSLGRVRISSLEPAELTPDLAGLMAENAPLVCDHMHLPLQSGSDRILKLMRRTYDSQGYREAVDRFRACFPRASIGADVIPGFPGETEEDFQATVELIKSLKLSYLHVFPYSQRPNTAAARMPGHIPGDVTRERAATLRTLSETLAHDYAQGFIGQTLSVLWENDEDKAGRRLGHTSNYLSVAASGSSLPLPGTFTKATIKGFIEPGKLLARLL
jgi:threonylcarbamoyladenosine tRNA methylthiotransferase MtaB